MWIKAGNILLNMDKIKMLSIDPDMAPGKGYMRLHAFVEGIEEPVLLAMTPPASDAHYSEELTALKSYIKAIYKGFEEGWNTYELGQAVSGVPSDEEVDLITEMAIIDRTIELARICHDAVKAGDTAKSDVERRRLDAHIGSLTHDQRVKVLALCWFGRGDFNRYGDAVKHTTTIPSDDIAGYLSDKFPLDEYLSSGIHLLSERP